MQAGDKVEYKVGGKWKSGIIHGVKKAEVKGSEQVVGYLIDTGKDERVDEVEYNKRDEVISQRIKDLESKGSDRKAASEKVMAQKDLPKSVVEIKKIRHPEQVEVLPGDIKPAE